MSRITALFASALLLASAAAPVQAQQPRPRELIFFRDVNFRGPTHAIRGTQPSLSLPFRPRSVRAAPGDIWQICARTNHRTPCMELESSANLALPATLINIRSARVLRTVGIGGTGPAGPALQGMASSFFRAPEDRGRRLLACPDRPATAACAADTARRFCQARGYAGGARFQLLETVGRDVFLADVLCTRS